jgi:hypothetical protein
MIVEVWKRNACNVGVQDGAEISGVEKFIRGFYLTILSPSFTVIKFQKQRPYHS